MDFVGSGIEHSLDLSTAGYGLLNGVEFGFEEAFVDPVDYWDGIRGRDTDDVGAVAEEGAVAFVERNMVQVRGPGPLVEEAVEVCDGGPEGTGEIGKVVVTG